MSEKQSTSEGRRLVPEHFQQISSFYLHSNWLNQLEPESWAKRKESLVSIELFPRLVPVACFAAFY